MSNNQIELVIKNGEYILNKKIGNGSFGQVYLGFNRNTGGEVAIKLESKENKRNMLAHEYIIYDKCLRNGLGFPSIHWYGIQDEYRILIMELMGPNLSELLKKCGGKLSLKTTVWVAIQMLDRIRYLHDKSFIHRDLKPENFVIGRCGREKFIHLLDFGLAVRYKNSDGQHIKDNSGCSFVGTVRYAGINSHLGYKLSRRDDLESWFYIIMYFLRGNLPWMGHKDKDKQKYHRKIKNIKMQTKIEELAEGYPHEFMLIFTHIKNLKFNEQPDYIYIMSLLKQVADNIGSSVYDPYDWEIQV